MTNLATSFYDSQGFWNVQALENRGAVESFQNAVDNLAKLNSKFIAAVFLCFEIFQTIFKQADQGHFNFSLYGLRIKACYFRNLKLSLVVNYKSDITLKKILTECLCCYNLKLE